MKQEYYFTQMDKPSQAAYRAMYEGFRAAAQAFLVPKLDNKVLSDLFFRLRLDHPEIFYVCSFNYRFDPRAESVKMFPVYMFDKKKISLFPYHSGGIMDYVMTSVLIILLLTVNQLI